MYRSSVLSFAKAMLCEAGCTHGEEVRMIKRRLSEEKTFQEEMETQIAQCRAGYLEAARIAMPPEDWGEILRYIVRYYSAYGFRAPALGGDGKVHLFLQWLAAVAVCALDDIGR